MAVEAEGSVYIALPYGERTDWAKNVLANGTAEISTGGRTYAVDLPRVVPMAEVTRFFGPKEQRLHRRFHVETALQVHLHAGPPSGAAEEAG